MSRSASDAPAAPRPEARRPGRPLGSEGIEGREALLCAARELLTEKGLPRVTIRELAERAGVGPALVNYYFGSKDGLLQAIIEEQAKRARERLQRAAEAPGSAPERLRGFIREIVAAMQDNPYLPRLIVEQILFADDDAMDRFAREFAGPSVRAVQQLISEGVAAGRFRRAELQSLVPLTIGACAHFFLFMPIFRRVFDLEEVTSAMIERFADDVADLILNGLLLREEHP